MGEYGIHERAVSGSRVNPEGFGTCTLLLFFVSQEFEFDFDVGAYFFLRFSRWVVTASQ